MQVLPRCRPRLVAALAAALAVALEVQIQPSEEQAKSAQISCDSTPAQIKSWTSSTISSLEKKNYTVVEGSFRVGNMSAGNDQFAGNPGNPYTLYYKKSTFVPILKLAEKEAVLFVGCTPSSTAYFSWRSYILAQDRSVVFAALGDSLNNLVINTTSKGTTSGGHTAAIVTTADEGTYQAISDAMATAGLVKAAHNLEAIPSSLLDMEQSWFIMLHRASVWGNDSERQAYFKQNRRVYFITPPQEKVAIPLPVLPLRLRGDGNSESDMPEVTANLAKLRENVLVSMTSKGYTLTSDAQVIPLVLDGFQCLRENTDCLGDNRDTNYLEFWDEQFNENDVYVVLGPNSVETSKCTYTNMGLYAFNPDRETTNLTIDNRQLIGSGKDFGVDTDLVFAYSVQMSCDAQPFCLEVGKEIPVDRKWLLAFRTYMEPATATAPRISELILPRVLKFSKSSDDSIAVRPRKEVWQTGAAFFLLQHLLVLL